MKKNTKKLWMTGIMLVMAFAIWTVLVQTVDVKPAGQSGTNIGFSVINTMFFSLTGVHMTIYALTDWLGIIPLIVCAAFGIIGFTQMIKRKSLLKTDRDIILLGIYYIVVILGYLLFEMIPVNYRPVLICGKPEASYPSSTTLLVLSVMPTLVFEVKRRFENTAVIRTVEYATVIFSVFTVTGRLVSGIHWLTDIIGGVLLSSGLFYIYKGAVLALDNSKKRL